MAGGWGERMIRLLDWCWPFPLGIVTCTLTLVVTTGIWLAIRSPQPTVVRRPPGQSVPTEIPGQVVPSPLPPPAQYSTPKAVGEASPGINPIGRRVSIPIRTETPGSSSTPRGIPPPDRVPATAARAKPAVKQAEAQKAPVAPRLSAAQQAKITDRLTIGRFLMDRKEYAAAIKEFQAALAIDPESREAQAAIQKARAAVRN